MNNDAVQDLYKWTVFSCSARHVRWIDENSCLMLINSNKTLELIRLNYYLYMHWYISGLVFLSFNEGTYFISWQDNNIKPNNKLIYLQSFLLALYIIVNVHFD